MAAFDEVIAAYRDDPTPELRKLIAKAMCNKGAVLSTLGRSADALA